jgi:hypothetical protein
MREQSHIVAARAVRHRWIGDPMIRILPRDARNVTIDMLASVDGMSL